MDVTGPHTVKEVSGMLEKSEKTVYRMLRTGKLKGYKDMDIWRIYIPVKDIPIKGFDGSVRTQSSSGMDNDINGKGTMLSISRQNRTSYGYFLKGILFGVFVCVSLVVLLELLGFLNIIGINH